MKGKDGAYKLSEKGDSSIQDPGKGRYCLPDVGREGGRKSCYEQQHRKEEEVELTEE